MGSASAQAPESVPAGRILISEINSNHDSRTPQALARNVVLIRELNSNLNKVRCAQGPCRLRAASA